jgi:CO/xanthine dehydrogenase Mo-binding subunit
VKAVGARVPRYDGVAHVTGRTVFVEDFDVPGAAWVKALRSPHPHAGIAKLDASAAEKMKGVRAIVTAADVPLNVYGHLSALGIPGDEPLLAEKEVRYVGQPIAVVAAEDEEVARAAVDAIEVDYDVREPLFDVRKAFDPDAPQIHEWGNWYPHFEGGFDHRQIRKGDIDAAFAQADLIV